MNCPGVGQDPNAPKASVWKLIFVPFYPIFLGRKLKEYLYATGGEQRWRKNGEQFIYSCVALELTRFFLILIVLLIIWLKTK